MKQICILMSFIFVCSLFGDDNSALKEVRKEKKVSKAEIIGNVLYATVKDDGTNRKGYAEYLCYALKENSASAKTVTVVDNKGKILGKSDCNW